MHNRRPPVVYSNYYRPSVPVTPVKKKRTSGLYKIIIGFASIALVYYVIGAPGINSPKNNGVKKVTAAQTQAMPMLSQSNVNAMQQQINNAINTHPGFDIGVSITDLNSGKSYNYGENEPFIAASVSKILTACLFLNQVEHGNASLSQDINGTSARYQLQQLIEQSDNDAWQAFNDLLGHDQLKNYASELGLTNYDPDTNSLTVNDISKLLSQLYKHQLLNQADTNLLLNYMKNANETEFISASVPEGVSVYHKAGWLEDRIHDAAIIDNGKHPYVLVIFTKDSSGTYDSNVGQTIFSDITKATTSVFL